MSELPSIPAQRILGHSGIAVSPIAWGMWRFAEDGRSASEAAAFGLVSRVVDPDKLMATATASSKKFDVPINAAGAAVSNGTCHRYAQP